MGISLAGHLANARKVILTTHLPVISFPISPSPSLFLFHLFVFCEESQLKHWPRSEGRGQKYSESIFFEGTVSPLLPSSRFLHHCPYFSSLARLHLQVLQGEPLQPDLFLLPLTINSRWTWFDSRQPTVIPRVSFARDRPPRVREWWLIKSPFVRSSQM